MFSSFDQFFMFSYSTFLINLFMFLIFSYLISIKNFSNKKIMISLVESLKMKFVLKLMEDMKNSMGYNTYSEKYMILIFSIFFLILNFNLMGMIPWTLPLTSYVHLTLSLSFMTVMGSLTVYLYIFLENFFSIFSSKGVKPPLSIVVTMMEFLSFFLSMLSLGFRLGVNILSGHVMLVIMGSMMSNLFLLKWFNLIWVLPSMILILIMFLEMFMAMVQAYMFSLLFSVYVSDGLNLK